MIRRERREGTKKAREAERFTARSHSPDLCVRSSVARRFVPPVFPLWSRRLVQALGGLREAAGVRLLGLRQRLDQLGDVVEALLASLLREARVHRLVLVRLAGGGGLQVLLRGANGQARRRIAHLLH